MCCTINFSSVLISYKREFLKTQEFLYSAINMFKKIYHMTNEILVLEYVAKYREQNPSQIEGVNSMPVQTCMLPPPFISEDLPKAYGVSHIHSVTYALLAFELFYLGFIT